MIFLGASDTRKAAEIARYVRSHPVDRVVLLEPARFALSQPGLDAQSLGVSVERVEWAEIIQYRFFYPLLQRITADTLVVVNECLRTQDRSDLTYNCIRHYLANAGHQLVFQRLPIIDTLDDVMVLFDFDTKSRWKREAPRRALLGEAAWDVTELRLGFTGEHVSIDPKTRAAYDREKRALLDGIGLGDPHTIPRNLLLVGGRAKHRHLTEGGLLAPRGGAARPLVGRNNRFKLPTLVTYDEARREPCGACEGRTVFELCHRFLDFADLVSATGQTEYTVLTTELKVDRWYLERFTAWAGRVADAYAALRG